MPSVVPLNFEVNFFVVVDDDEVDLFVFFDLDQQGPFFFAFLSLPSSVAVLVTAGVLVSVLCLFSVIVDKGSDRVLADCNSDRVLALVGVFV